MDRRGVGRVSTGGVGADAAHATAVVVVSARVREEDEPPRLLVWLAKYLVSDRHRFGEDVELSTVEEAVAWLRAQSEAIVCGGADWTLASAERTLPSGPTIAPAQVGMG